MSRDRRGMRLMAGVAAVAAASAAASGALVRYNGATTNDSGTGFGNVLNVLTLHDDRPGADHMAAGSVVWTGSADVFGTVGGGLDTRPQQSLTRTVSELTAIGVAGSNLGVVLNLNQTGASPQVDLGDFFVRFQDPGGATLFDARFDDLDPLNAPTTALAPVAGNGTGAAGHLFPVILSAGEAAQFFGNPANRLAMYVNASDPIVGVNGGPEVFYVAAVPEPATAALAACLAAAALGRRRR